MDKIMMSKESLDALAGKASKAANEIESLSARIDKVNSLLDMEVKGRANIGNGLTKIKTNLKKEKDFYAGVQKGITRTKEDVFGEDSRLKTKILGTFGLIAWMVSTGAAVINNILRDPEPTTDNKSNNSETTSAKTETTSQTPVTTPPTSVVDINKLKEAIPAGTKWDDNSTDGEVKGCFAFARKAFKTLYGDDMPNSYTKTKYKYPSSKLTHVELAGGLAETKSSVTTEEIKNCLSGAVPGDVLQVARYKGNNTSTTPHTMIVESVDAGGVRVYHGNWDDKVCSTYFTWADFKKQFLRNPDDKAGVGVSIYRHK